MITLIMRGKLLLRVYIYVYVYATFLHCIVKDAICGSCMYEIVHVHLFPAEWAEEHFISHHRNQERYRYLRHPITW